jgi:hypothetical protein
MIYTSKLLQHKTYEITTVFNDQPVVFSVVVAEDETEIDGLVSVHLNYLENPTPTYTQPTEPEPTNLAAVVQEQQALIESLTTRLTALEGSA